MNWTLLARVFSLSARVFTRKWAVLLISCALLTVGMIEIVLVQSVSSEVREQLSTGDLEEFHIATRSGMNDELASVLGDDEIQDMRAASSNSSAIFIPQYLRQAPLQDDEDDLFAPRAVVRGFENLGDLQTLGITLASGRWPEPGSDELLAGQTFKTSGDQDASELTVKLDNRNFRIVGTFDAGGLPFGNDLIGETSQIRSSQSSWSSVWVKAPEGDISGFLSTIEDRLNGSVEFHNGQTFFEESFRQSRDTITSFGVTLVIAVVLATIAAFASTMEILISMFRRDFDIISSLGIDKFELTGSLVAFGAMLGLVTGAVALALVAFFFVNNGYELPVGAQNILIYPRLDAATALIGLAVAAITGALGMLIASRKLGNLAAEA